MKFEVQNLKQLSDAITEKHKNFVLTEVNKTCLRMAVNEGEFPWHFHKNSDEFFIVLEGELKIEFKDREHLVLGPNDSTLIPAGVIHRTRANGRTVNLCFEKTDADTIFLDQ